MSGDISVGAIGFLLPAKALTTIVGAMFRAALGAVGIFMLARICWSWFLLQTHGGNHDREENAKGALKEGLVGLFVVSLTASVAQGAVSLAARVASRYLS